MGNVNCRGTKKTAINYSFPWFLLFFVSVSECIFIPRQCARGQLRMQQGHWTRHTFEGDSPHRGAPCATSLIFCGFSLGAFHPLQLTLPIRTELSWHVPNVFFFNKKKLILTAFCLGIQVLTAVFALTREAEVRPPRVAEAPDAPQAISEAPPPLPVNYCS